MTIELRPVTSDNVRSVRYLNQILFPINYHDSFYSGIVKAGELARLAYLGETVVGTVSCRLDVNENANRLYIMTLGCLAPYRRQKIGSKLLQHVLDYAASHCIDSIYLHVQVNNESAIEFYKRFGFEITETKRHYYRRIEPADAYVLHKIVTNCVN